MRILVTKNLDAHIDNALKEVDGIYRRRRDRLAGKSADNGDIYTSKVAEALWIQSGHPAGPLLTLEAAAKEMSVEDLALAVLAKHAETSQTVVDLEVGRQNVQAVIRAAKDPLEIESIVVGIKR